MGDGFPLAGRILWVSKGRCNVYVCGEAREVLTSPGALEKFTPESLVEGYNFGNHEHRDGGHPYRTCYTTLLDLGKQHFPRYQSTLLTFLYNELKLGVERRRGGPR